MQRVTGSIPGGGIYFHFELFASYCSQFGEAYTNEIKHETFIQSNGYKEIYLILNNYGDGLYDDLTLKISWFCTIESPLDYVNITYYVCDRNLTLSKATFTPDARPTPAHSRLIFMAWSGTIG